MRRTVCLLGMLLVAFWATPMGMVSASAQSEGVTRPDHAPRWGTGDAAFTVTSATVRFDPQGTDQFTILASFNNLSLVSGQTVLFWAGSFYDQIAVAKFKQEGQKYTYTGPQGGTGLSKLVLDFDHGNATIVGKNIFLSGFSNPLPVGLIAGAFDQCAMVAFNVKGNVWSSKSGTNSSMPCVIPGTPALSADGLFVGKAENIAVAAKIAPYEGLAENSIQLVRVDNNLNVVGTPLCTLLDNGNVQNGDQSAGDRFFSCIGRLRAKAPGTINLAVRALVGGQPVFSPGVALEAVNEVTPTKFQETVLAHAKAVKIWKNKASEYGVTREARLKAAAQIKKVAGIADAGLSPDNSTIWLDFQSGMEGALLINPAANGGKSRELPTPPSSTGLKTGTGSETPTPSSAGESPQIFGASGTDFKVGNCDVFVYAPFLDELSPYDVADELNDFFSKPDDQEQFRVNYLRDTDCTVAALDKLTDYGTVVIGGHGGLNKHGVLLVATREVFNKLSKTYKFAVSNRALARVWYPTLDEYYFAFKPNFVAHLPGSFKNSIVYIGSCFSAEDKSFGKAFWKKGAKAYFGYSGITDGKFLIPTATKLFDGLVIRHLNTGEAYDRVRRQYGSDRFIPIGSKRVKYTCRKNPYDLYRYAEWRVCVRGIVNITHADGSSEIYVDENWCIGPDPDESSFQGGFTGMFYEGKWNRIEDDNQYTGKTTFTLNDNNASIDTFAMAFAGVDTYTSIVGGIAGTNLPLTYQDDDIVVFSVGGVEACSHLPVFTYKAVTGDTYILQKPECKSDSFFTITLMKQW